MFKLIAGMTLAMLVAGCDLSESNAADSSIAASCTSCHSGNLDLAGEDAAEIAGLIREILDGDLAHPPLGMDDTSDDAIEELARQLTAK